MTAEKVIEKGKARGKKLHFRPFPGVCTSRMDADS
jgi:hypothetical protein